MIIVRSINNIPIRLTNERWGHIITRHPEMEGQRERVLETVAEPELMQLGDSGVILAIRFYDVTPLTSKYLVAAFRETENDGFLITAYYTAKPSTRRTVLWKR